MGVKKVKFGPFEIGEFLPPVFIAGPCVIEDEDTVLHTARFLKDVSEKYGARIIFKTSYDKANRSAFASFRGPGLKEGLRILEKVKEETNLPLTTDVHCTHEVETVAKVVDVVQIPAFLSRQTDLLVEAGKHAGAVNIKKGQFLSARGAVLAAQKVHAVGNENVTITERGTTFGYHDLVVDFRNIYLIQEAGIPVLIDITHSLQKPEALGDTSGGDVRFAPMFAKAGIAIGVQGIFAEVHPHPETARSDRATMIHLEDFEKIVAEVLAIYRAFGEES